MGRESSVVQDTLTGIPSDCLKDEAFDDEKRDIATRKMLEQHTVEFCPPKYIAGLSFHRFGSEQNLTISQK